MATSRRGRRRLVLDRRTSVIAVSRRRRRRRRRAPDWRAWRRPKVAVVLGAGGTVGHAFHAGVLTALHDELGWDARRADLLVGTSAGSIVASMLRAGMPAADLAAGPSANRCRRPAGRRRPGRAGPPGRGRGRSGAAGRSARCRRRLASPGRCGRRGRCDPARWRLAMLPAGAGADRPHRRAVRRPVRRPLAGPAAVDRRRAARHRSPGGVRPGGRTAGDGPARPCRRRAPSRPSSSRP